MAAGLTVAANLTGPAGLTTEPGDPPDATRAADSRAATAALLGILTGDGHRPAAWWRFALAAGRRSAVQAASRPVALGQLTVLHAVAALVADRAPSGRRRLAWPASSWLAAATHLGMLERRRRLSVPDVLTLGRGLLPAAGDRLGVALPLLAVASDVLDGPLARRGTTTRFGWAADFLADTAVWTWFAVRREPDRRVRAAALAAWAAPVAALTAVGLARGRVPDIPRSRWFRPAATVQAVLAARALARAAAGDRARTGRARGPRRVSPAARWGGSAPR